MITLGLVLSLLQESLGFIILSVLTNVRSQTMIRNVLISISPQDGPLTVGLSSFKMSQSCSLRHPVIPRHPTFFFLPRRLLYPSPPCLTLSALALSLDLSEVSGQLHSNCPFTLLDLQFAGDS